MLSGYYSGTRIAKEAPWNYSASDSFHVFHPAYMLARYNGAPKARKLILEMADSMMDHYYDGRLHVLIDVETDADQIHERTREWPLFYAAWKLTGNAEIVGYEIINKDVRITRFAGGGYTVVNYGEAPVATQYGEVDAKGYIYGREG